MPYASKIPKGSVWKLVLMYGYATHHVLALEELLRNDRGEAAEQVPATINHNNLR